MFADLHLHTNESDGTLTPKQLIERVQKTGLSAIAITDHDTTAGIKAALQTPSSDLQVIPGIELSCADEKDQEIHIVGLWIDSECEALQRKLSELREDRVGRSETILQLLNNLGFSIKHEDVLKFANKDVLSRSHIASAMVEKGIVSCKQKAFDMYLGYGRPAYVKRRKLTPTAAVELILQAGGVPILAHPGLLKDLEIIPELVEAGLIGIEVVHHSHDKQKTQYFKELAAANGLLPSGGSDCHGPGGKDQVYLGKYKIPLEWVEKLAEQRPNTYYSLQGND